ncbi:MAG TPA: NADH-quinone oxidoreductase subunit J [Desulfomicrobium sp.]|nr:NADH-quinone oxidoreductase subunit J [Desulfomicrobium sp.]
METLALFAYALYLAIIVGGGFTAVTNPNLVRALVGLVAAMFGVAGMYFLMNAPFVGLMQLLIYVGAISVLIFFAIMLTRPPAGGEEQATSKRRPMTFVAAAAPVALLGAVCLKAFEQTVDVPDETGIKELGQGLLGTYGLAFELISVVLLVAMAGAVLLGFKRREEA